MAVVTDNVTPVRTYQPFEGLSEAQRLWSAVPRGILRFQATDAVSAKPINDDLIVNITGSLPPSFAYVLSSLSWAVSADRMSDWEAVATFRIFNGLPNAEVGNEQDAIFDFDSVVNPPGTVASKKILSFGRGSIREWFPNPITRTQGAAGLSFTLTGRNGNNTAELAGTQFFNCAFYQYELNQAVRFPLNFPLPVGIR